MKGKRRARAAAAKLSAVRAPVGSLDRRFI
jgi:hypothetical protein